jgi:PPOX class probable F420-dependent enzyme
VGEEWRGEIGTIERDELDAFLAEGVVCRLAVLDEQGWPYVVPAWFEWDPAEESFWIVPREKSAWARYMARDPRVALTIDTPTPPYRKVSAQGRAEVVEEPNIGGRWVEIANRMSTRYLGEHGPDYLVPTLDQPRWLFRIRPTRLVTWQGVDWHPRYKSQRAT